MSDYPAIVNTEKAARLILQIQDRKSQETIQLLIEGVQQFFREQPSQLRSPFDLAFFVEILMDRIELVRSSLDGTQEAKGWWEDQDFPLTYPVLDPGRDVSDTGIRQRQAGNYIAARDGRRIQSALLTLIAWVYTRQNPNAKYIGGEPIITIRPEYAFDYLFMVMAVDYALRPSQPVRQLLEGKAETAPATGFDEKA
jgi:hypothetical protein